MKTADLNEWVFLAIANGVDHSIINRTLVGQRHFQHFNYKKLGFPSGLSRREHNWVATYSSAKPHPPNRVPFPENREAIFGEGDAI